MTSTKNFFHSQFLQFSECIDDGVEFQESDIWNSGDGRGRLISQASLESHLKNKIQPPRYSKKSSVWKISSVSGISSTCSPAIHAPSSMPVNIPDWSKILGADGDHWRREVGEDPDIELDASDDEDEEDWIPPHEYAAQQLAKRRGKAVAFSVQEGSGRMLKGRDLYRVRNAIWKQTGFED